MAIFNRKKEKSAAFEGAKCGDEARFVTPETEALSRGSETVFSQGSTRRGAARLVLLLALVSTLVVTSSRLQADTGNCSGTSITLPFMDVMGNPFFCQIAQIYAQGISLGTSATTYSPTQNVTREQMAAFLGRTLDTGLQRGSQRAALDQFWTTTPHYDLDLGTTDLGGNPFLTRSDGFHVWVADISGNVYRVRASDGTLVATYTGTTDAYGVLCAMGKVFVTADSSPTGSLYMIDPSAAAGAVTTVTSALGPLTTAIAFDGSRIWTANNGSVSIVTPGATLPWSVTTVGGFNRVVGLVFDGTNVWTTETGSNVLKKLDSNGNVLLTVPMDTSPQFPIFDGKNIWVPCLANTVKVVRASTGEVLATLSGNGLGSPRAAAFDGQRILVTNNSGDSVSLWKASDLTPIGAFSTGADTDPWGVCSDGQYFWITLQGTDQLARF
jgi:hypothetical protein